MESANSRMPPVLAFIELTRKCDLLCMHCRASAGMDSNAPELALSRVAEFLGALKSESNRNIHVIYTGGNIALRSDIVDFMKLSRSLGMTFSLSPSPSSLVNTDFLKAAKDNGASSMSVSIDGVESTHDRIRGVSGSFHHAIRILDQAKAMRLPVQVNTLVAGETVSELPKIYGKLVEMQVPVWELFFLINTGRGDSMQDLRPQEMEDVIHWLVHLSRNIRIRTVEAPFYNRVLVSPCETIRYGNLYKYLHGMSQTPANPEDHHPPTGLHRGKTIFLASDGNVFPSGFLPVSLGSVDGKGLPPALKEYMRNDFSFPRESIGPECSLCPFFDLCGGSRARALAYTGSHLSSDPGCIMSSEFPVIKQSLHNGRAVEYEH
ncbi:MAG: radical SAM protein [Candidatus Thermoplasmatota archaeon]|nr:radical SAM protein [Candidatus Thermoplasmatota archaeon]